MGVELAGVILAGGNGKRMGFDKARLSVYGQPVLLRLATILSPFTSEIVVAIGKKRDLDLPPGVRMVEDLFPGLGPLYWPARRAHPRLFPYLSCRGL